MNWVDIILLVFLIKSAVQGFSRGFVLSAFKMVGVIVALYMGVFYREAVVGILKTQLKMDSFLSGILLTPAVTNDVLSVLNIKGIVEMALGALGVFLVFLGVQLLFLIPAYFIDGVVKVTNMTPLNRFLGVIFGIGRLALWFAFLSAILTPLLLAFPGSWLDKGLSNSYILNNIRFLDFISPIVVKLI